MWADEVWLGRILAGVIATETAFGAIWAIARSERNQTREVKHSISKGQKNCIVPHEATLLVRDVPFGWVFSKYGVSHAVVLFWISHSSCTGDRIPGHFDCLNVIFAVNRH